MNLTLLAKKGWRVATNQASLLSKLLKGRYFKLSSFLHAKVETNPSFGWRSLLEGRKILSKGMRWQVGNGKDIDIWKDPWIPRITNFGSRRGEVEGYSRVSQLIDNGTWQEEFIGELFENEDVSFPGQISLAPYKKWNLLNKLGIQECKGDETKWWAALQANGRE
ncbi:hypothetical protein LIER_29239 [Lithospermum erythrorhizon]|uniref:Uncharacterized protein n=1 Tax=Lithospermum erythrorhizon TaxID=34254 RepID=A0AAV3RPE7_LITER